MKVGVVGCGSIGARYAAWLLDLGAEVAVCDTDTARLAALPVADRVAAFDDLAALLGWRPAKVLVATPPHHHRDPAVAALEAGADVLVEKPMAHALGPARDIAAAAARTGRRLHVVCNMRFHPGPATIAAHLGRIGRPLFGHAWFGHRLSQMRPAGTRVYAASAAQGGGVVLDCIHEIDYLQWLLGPVKSTRAWMGRIGPDPIEADDHAEIGLEFESGARVALHLDFLMRFKRRGAEIHGTDGSLVWQSEGRSPEHCEVWYGDRDGREMLYRSEGVDDPACYRQMLAAMLGDGAGLQDGAAGLRALEVAMEILS